jgi:CxxC motif-containing protein (DUF1111 family)
MKLISRSFLLVTAAAIAACVAAPPPSGNVVDPPPDPSAPARAGGPLAGLSPAQMELFAESLDVFQELDTVDGASNTSAGLGPRFNLDSCSGCHAFPAVGGSSGFVNPQPIVAKRDGARNDAEIPFLRGDGPIVEARFKFLMDAAGNFLTGSRNAGAGGRRPDGGVHALFTITGRTDANGCDIQQPPFKQAWIKNNVSLRIPTPVFGLGLVEAIDDSTIAANSLERMKVLAKAPSPATTQRAGQTRITERIKMYEQLGIVGRPGRGRENRSGNDSSITRFGWKAQNKSLLLFAGEAYNVEQGVTNELFPNERDAEAIPLPETCKLNGTPEDDIGFEHLESPRAGPAASPAKEFATIAGDLTKFELFMRLLAPPQPACDLTKAGSCSESIVRGSALFDQIYCSACHVRSLPIGPSSIEAITAQQTANLYSDLLLHKMGDCPPNPDHTPKCLADGIAQGEARGDEFRTAPLWGVGQRVFFLHDGRARDLPSAILAHQGPGSEANAVVRLYVQLPRVSQQDLIDFLRSL